MNDTLGRGKAVWVDQAFNINLHHTACDGFDLRDVEGVAPAVREAAARLAGQLGLTPPYVAVQYRAGGDRRAEDARTNSGICYGPATIERALAQTPHAQTGRRFWLTNARGYPTEAAHPQSPKPPSAARLLVEALVAARADFVLLNPGSTIRYLVLRLRKLEGLPTSREGVRFVRTDETVDACTCNTTDSDGSMQRLLGAPWCSRPGEFARGAPSRWKNRSDDAFKKQL